MRDLIDRQAAIDALAEAMPSLTTPDGCGQFDHDIQVTDEAYVDCMRIIHDLPSAQLMEDIRAMCGECDAWNQYKNYPRWEQFNPCTVCQEFDCTGCKFRRT